MFDNLYLSKEQANDNTLPIQEQSRFSGIDLAHGPDKTVIHPFTRRQSDVRPLVRFNYYGSRGHYSRPSEDPRRS
jgi:hypothetical protein